MRTKFIETGSAKDGKTVVDVPKNPYLGLILRIRGTTDSGETLLLSDVGSIRTERNGNQIQSGTFEFYHERTDLKRGFPLAPTGGAAAAEDIVCWIPFFYNNLPNVLDVQSKEEVDVTLDFDATTLSTRFGSNAVTYELYGIVEEAISEKYILDVRSQNIEKGSSGRFQETLDRPNIAGLILQDPDDDIDEVQFEVDGEIVWDNIDQDVLTIISNLSNQIETSGNELGEINLVETGDIREAYNKNSLLNITFNGAGTLKVTIFSIKESSFVNVSRQRASQFLAKKEKNLVRSN